MGMIHRSGPVARGLALGLAFVAVEVHATCDQVWDGDKLAQNVRGRDFAQPFRLNDRNGRLVANTTAGQIQAFAEARERISAVAGFSPKLVVCGDKAPNAFATNTANGPVVGVTVGMLAMVNGDRDMAAEVIGHEYAHHLKNHMAEGQTRDAILGFIGLLAGVALERYGNKHGVYGVGYDVGAIGSTLVARKFDRDQEREADELGFDYLVKAGFDPNGAINLSQRMLRQGSGGAGLFFDNHPGWEERTRRFQTLIAANPQAQVLANAKPSGGATPAPTAPPAQALALDSSYETSDAQRSFNDGLAALRRNDLATAQREIRAAANAGYAPAQVTLGYAYSGGRLGLQRDDAEAVRLYRLAADQGSPIGQSNLGQMYAAGRGGLAKDEVEAVRLTRLAADTGYALAQANLGSMYLNGRGGLPRDEAEALRLFRLAAEQNDGQGLANLGLMHLNGQGGLAKDPVEAERLFRLSVAKGNALGQANLGFMLANGIGGVAKDEVEAVRLLRLAANQGNALGQVNLGYMVSTGRGGLVKDDVEAARLYRLAAEQGHALGQSNLGNMYLNGRGVAKDPVEAARLFRLGAAQGNPNAQGNLGLMFAFGLGGVANDDDEALRLAQSAAGHGNSTGQAVLGLFYENGRGGLPRDVDEAVAWYRKSAAQGNVYAASQLKRLGRE